MMFGSMGNPDHEDSIRIIHRALEAGINVIDTADVYSRGESEEIVGRAIGPRTQEHLDGLLSGADIELSGDILDRIDEIVPPGTDLDPADNYAATPPALENASLRRR